MRKVAVAALLAVAVGTTPAEAGCAIHDPQGDVRYHGTVAVRAPALDVVEAQVLAGADATTFVVRVADLANASDDAPTGIQFQWDMVTSELTYYASAWFGPTGSGTGTSTRDEAGNASYTWYLPPPVIDVVNDTVTFTVPASALAIPAGTPTATSLHSWFHHAVGVGGRAHGQPAHADTAIQPGTPGWARC